MCVGCAAAYAAIAASTVTFSLSDMSAKESSLNFTIKYDDLAKAAAITTAQSGTASITIKSNAPEVKSAAVNRRINPGSHQAI
jgi:predicted DNA-binding protein (MmcQ/YjbR family)